MHPRIGVLAVVVFSLLVSSPGLRAQDRDLSGEVKALRDTVAALSEAGSSLAELARVQIQGGRSDEARSTLDLLDSVLALKEEAAARLKALGGAASVRPPKPAPDLGGGALKAAPSPRASREDLAKNGGGQATEQAVELALKWLADHQDRMGYWDCDGFMKMDKVPPVSDGAGNALYDVGVSSLALLAFLGAGETHLQGSYKGTVQKGLSFLLQVQDPEGCFGPRTSMHFTYNHAIAAQALAEAYGMTGSPMLKTAAQKGIDFIHQAQNPYLAWRYGVRPSDNDTSVTAWMVSALHAGKVAGLKVDQSGFDGAKAWIDKATEPEYGRVGYTARGTGPARPQAMMDKFPADKSESLTAAGMLMRVYLGEDPRRSEMFQKGMDLCLKVLPRWDEQGGCIDMYYWFWGTQAAFQGGGASWKAWNAALKAALLDQQRKDQVSFQGSWDPVGPWGNDGGRVYATALAAMCLEAYYRHPRIFTIKEPRRRLGGK